MLDVFEIPNARPPCSETAAIARPKAPEMIWTVMLPESSKAPFRAKRTAASVIHAREHGLVQEGGRSQQD